MRRAFYDLQAGYRVEWRRGERSRLWLPWQLSGAEAASGESVVDAHRLASDFLETAGLIADAHQEHGLVGVLQQIDNSLMFVLEVDGLPVGHQVEV